jgi:tricorn protease
MLIIYDLKNRLERSDENRRWFDEGHGVEPTHRVVADPTELAKGADPQIDKAIELILEELQQNPPKKMTRPAFQKR